VAKDVVGPRAKVAILNDAWRSVLPAMARLVAREPARVAGCVTNALYNVTSTNGARAGQWVEEMRRAGASCQSVAELLDCGTIVAWRSGMAQYRTGGIETARRLRVELVRSMFAWAEAVDVTAAIHRMYYDPWLRPEDAIEPPSTNASVRVVAKVGSFRGFGGEFLRPPVVRYLDGRFVATDFAGEVQSVWSLFADVFGAVFVRDSANIADDSKNSRAANSVDKVQWDAVVATIGDEANLYSVASDGGSTVALTVRTSHQVYLIARTQN
jgi:hypothetical protein